MPETDPPSRPPHSGLSPRNARLAAQLRGNLRRRKAQSRATEATREFTGDAPTLPKPEPDG